MEQGPQFSGAHNFPDLALESPLPFSLDFYSVRASSRLFRLSGRHRLDKGKIAAARRHSGRRSDQRGVAAGQQIATRSPGPQPAGLRHQASIRQVSRLPPASRSLIQFT
jgi:hypothetical protein